jgi:hypothetical protein
MAHEHVPDVPLHYSDDPHCPIFRRGPVRIMNVPPEGRQKTAGVVYQR